MKRACSRPIEPSHPFGHFGLDGGDVVHARGMFNPAQLFLKGRNGKQLRSELSFIVNGEVMATVFNKTVDEMPREVVNHELLGAQHHQRFVEEQQGFAILLIQFVEVNGGVGHHRGHVNLEPLVLMGRETTPCQIVEKGLEAGITADLLFWHSLSTEWLPFEPDEWTEPTNSCRIFLFREEYLLDCATIYSFPGF
jgi:hypothetical protein